MPTTHATIHAIKRMKIRIPEPEGWLLQPGSNVRKPTIFAASTSVAVSLQLGPRKQKSVDRTNPIRKSKAEGAPQQQGSTSYCDFALLYWLFQLNVPVSQAGSIHTLRGLLVIENGGEREVDASSTFLPGTVGKRRQCSVGGERANDSVLS